MPVRRAVLLLPLLIKISNLTVTWLLPIILCHQELKGVHFLFGHPFCIVAAECGRDMVDTPPLRFLTTLPLLYKNTPAQPCS